ncbi:hypothetical protein NKH18_27410 [Streptomyces sp. M10(2022)]
MPLSLIARGLNIVKGTRSAVRSVYLCVRPSPCSTTPPRCTAASTPPDCEPCRRAAARYLAGPG